MEQLQAHITTVVTAAPVPPARAGLHLGTRQEGAAPAGGLAALGPWSSPQAAATGVPATLGPLSINLPRASPTRRAL